MPPPERGGLARPSWATSEAAPSRPHPRLGATESSPPAAVCESVPAARRAAEGARVLTGGGGPGGCAASRRGGLRAEAGATTKGWGSRTEPPPPRASDQASASRASCSSGVSFAMPMPVAPHRRAKKMAIQLEIAHGMYDRVATPSVPAM